MKIIINTREEWKNLQRQTFILDDYFNVSVKKRKSFLYKLTRFNLTWKIQDNFLDFSVSDWEFQLQTSTSVWCLFLHTINLFISYTQKLFKCHIRFAMKTSLPFVCITSLNVTTEYPSVWTSRPPRGHGVGSSPRWGKTHSGQRRTLFVPTHLLHCRPNSVPPK